MVNIRAGNIELDSLDIRAWEILPAAVAYSDWKSSATLADDWKADTFFQPGQLARTTSTPGFLRPMALSIPAGVSATRGVGLPKGVQSRSLYHDRSL